MSAIAGPPACLGTSLSYWKDRCLLFLVTSRLVFERRCTLHYLHREAYGERCAPIGGFRTLLYVRYLSDRVTKSAADPPTAILTSTSQIIGDQATQCTLGGVPTAPLIRP